MTAPRVPLGDPTPRAVAVVVRGHKLLVMRRVLDGREYAVLPGGGIEPGETAAEAAVRELAEECTLEGRVLRHLFNGEHGGRAASYFLVDAPDGEPVLGGEEAAAHDADNSYEPAWATAGELELFPLLPEGIVDLVTEAAWPLRVGVAGEDEWPVIERLWQLYQHDLSEFRGSAPDAAGAFPPGRLPAYAGRDDRIAYLGRLGDVPCGFALVRRGDPGGSWVMGEFFVTRSTRGRGIASRFAGEVIGRHPGSWEIPFQDENPRAAAFWRRLAVAHLADVSERTIPIPSKSHLPDDVWLSGTRRN